MRTATRIQLAPPRQDARHRRHARGNVGQGICAVHKQHLPRHGRQVLHLLHRICRRQKQGERQTAEGPQAYGSLRKRRDGRRAFEARRLCLPKFRKRRRGRKLTRPLVFSGKYLFANADAPNGGTETKLRDAAGKPIETSTFENCEGVSADSIAAKMKWRNSGDSELTKTRLYSDAHSL